MPDCRVQLDAARLRRSIEELADDIIRTWVHESLHARLPFSPRHVQESRLTRGYEEGMVEGLARALTGDVSGMEIREHAYEYYVSVYRALADALGIDTGRLLRSLWQVAPGEVRAAFVDRVVRLALEAGRPPLASAQRERLQALADTMFASSRGERLTGNMPALVATWRTVLL